MGTYYGQPILWRCVAFEKVTGYDTMGNPIIDSTDTRTTYADGYLPLMLADRIICLKAFDGKGTNTSGSHGRGYYESGQQGYYRRKYGSNYWADSNIRDWLNSSASAGNVTWSCGNAPTSSNMWGGYNAYNNEAGFLTNFTQSERGAMKTVTQKSLLDGYEHSGSSNTVNSNYHKNDYNIGSVVQNYATAYSEQVTDTMFLLDVKQINTVYNNSSILGNDYYIGTPTAEAVANSEYKDSSCLNSTTKWWSWLRSPDADDGSGSVRDVDSDGGVNYDDAYDGDGGVRPAFYLNLSSLNLKGSGTYSNPYKVSQTTYEVNIDTNITNGTVTTTSQEYACGETVTLIVEPAQGYRVKSVSIDGIALTPVQGVYNFVMPAEAVRITAEFELIPTYNVTLPKSTKDGTIIADVTTGLVDGTEVTLTATPDCGYVVDYVKVNGVALLADQDGITYNFTINGADAVVEALFEKITYAVNIDTNITNGTVTANEEYAWCETVILTVTPDTDYRIKSVSKDGEAITPVCGVYSFTMPAEAVTITAEFEKITYAVIIDTNITNGTVTANEEYAWGETVTLTVEPAQGYRVKFIKKDGTALTPVQNVYSFEMPKQAVTITAEFEKKELINVVFPTFTKTDYVIGTKLTEIKIENTNEYGTFSWQNPNQKIVGGENICKMIFTPKDNKNYEYDILSKDYTFTNSILPNAISVADGESIQFGETATRNVMVSSNKKINAVVFDVEYPLDVELTSISNKDFELIDISEKSIKNGVNVATIVAQYSNTDFAKANIYYTLLALNFNISKTSTVGEKAITIKNVTFYDENSNDTIVTDIENSTLQVTPKLVESITISGNSTAIDTAEYNAIILPDYATDKTVTWSVSDESVATISTDGVLTALKNGSVTITAVANDGSGVVATKTVTTKTTKLVETIKISGERNVYDSSTYSCVITPETAIDKSVTWSVSDESVATISADGVLTALKNGSVTITAVANDGSGVKATKTINVYVNAKINTLVADKGMFDKPFEPNCFNYTLYAGEDATSVGITAVFSGGNLKLNGTNLMINKVKKTIALNNAETVITLNRAGVKDNIDSVYTITILKANKTSFDVECYKTALRYYFDIEVSEDVTFDLGKLVLAGYSSSGALKLLKSKTVTTDESNASFLFDYTDVSLFKVMLLDSLEGLKPLTEAMVINEVPDEK